MIHKQYNSIATIISFVGFNRLQNGHDELFIHYREIEDVKSGPPSRGSNPRPSDPSDDLWLHLQIDLLASLFRLIQRPGKVAEWWDVCTRTSRSLFLRSGMNQTYPLCSIRPNNAVPLLELQLVASEPGILCNVWCMS